MNHAEIKSRHQEISVLIKNECWDAIYNDGNYCYEISHAIINQLLTENERLHLHHSELETLINFHSVQETLADGRDYKESSKYHEERRKFFEGLKEHSSE